MTKTLNLNIGQTVMTQAIAAELSSLGLDEMAIAEYLHRHANGDWGDLHKADIEMNNTALTAGGRILSSYKDTPIGKIWILTEWDRSVTTVMFPSDY